MAAEDVTVTVDYGEPGKSAYDLAVSLGYVGTLSQWIASLNGGAADYIQSFAQASGLTTAAVIQVMTRLNSPLPLPTGAATDAGLGAIVTAINTKPVTTIPDTLVKTNDLAGLATNEKLDLLNGSIAANQVAITALNDLVNTLIGLVGDNSTVSVNNFPDSISDGATATNQNTTITALSGLQGSASSIDAKLSGTGSIKTLPNYAPATSGALSNSRIVAVTGTNNTTLNGGGALFNTMLGINTTGTVLYVQLANVSNPTVGTTVPTFTLPVPANGSQAFNGNMLMRFGTGLSLWFGPDAKGLSTAGVAADSLIYYLSYTKG